MTVTGRLYDWKTPFNGVPVEKVHESWAKAWGTGADVVLIYRDGEFSGIAEPLGAYTIDQVVAKYQSIFEEQAATANVPSVEERTAAALEALVLQGLPDMTA